MYAPEYGDKVLGVGGELDDNGEEVRGGGGGLKG